MGSVRSEVSEKAEPCSFFANKPKRRSAALTAQAVRSLTDVFGFFLTLENIWQNHKSAEEWKMSCSGIQVVCARFPPRATDTAARFITAIKKK